LSFLFTKQNPDDAVKEDLSMQVRNAIKAALKAGDQEK